MSKKPIKFVSEFLIPNLNSRKFGNRLKWLDKEQKTFQIDWCHKAGPKWTEREAEVFVEWDKQKGHYQPEDKGYYTKSKQRFRALLYKLTTQGSLVQELSDSKFKKIYSITAYGKRKRRLTTSSESSESACSDEAEYMSDANPDLELDGYNRRLASNNCTLNILEDHSYTINPLQVAQTDYENTVPNHDGLVPLSFYHTIDFLDDPVSPSMYQANDSTEEKVIVKFNDPYCNNDENRMNPINVVTCTTPEVVTYVDIYNSSENGCSKISDFSALQNLFTNNDTTFHLQPLDMYKATSDVVVSEVKTNYNAALEEEPEMCNFDSAILGITIDDILNSIPEIGQNGSEDDSAST